LALLQSNPSLTAIYGMNLVDEAAGISIEVGLAFAG
jgi:hypothetical protein